MRAILTTPPTGGVQLSDFSAKDEKGIRIKTYATGICGTDKEIVGGRLPFIRPQLGNTLVLGHEALGIVEDSGDFQGFKKGDFVVPMVRRPGNCRMCRLGRQDYCEDGQFVEAGIRGKDGFMRDEFLEDPRFLLKVEGVDDKSIAVLTEPLKNVMKMKEIFNFLRTRIPWYCEDSTLACKNLYVFGTGTEGLLISVVFKTLGTNVVIVNRHPLEESEMSFLDQNKIDFLDTSSESIESRVMKEQMDVAIDGVGSMDVLKAISDNVRNNGIVILFGTAGQVASSNYQFIDNLVDKNTSVAGSTDGAKEHYREAIQFLGNYGGKYSLRKIITGTYRPDELHIFKEKEKGEIKKVIAWS